MKKIIDLQKKQVAYFFEVDIRAVERVLEQNGDELIQSGYEVLRDNRLKQLVFEVKNQGAPDINVGNKTTQLGIFNFRAF